MLGKLDREATPWRPVQAAKKPFDHTFGDDLQPAELGNFHGIEQVQTGTTGGGIGTRHGRGNVSARGRRSQTWHTICYSLRDMNARTVWPALMIFGLLPAARVSPGLAQGSSPPGSLSVWSDRERPYRRGDQAHIYVHTDKPGYLTILRVDTDGGVRVLFPREPWGRNRVSGRRAFEVMGPSGATSFRVDDHPGIGYLLAIVSSSSFDYQTITRGNHWDYRVIANGRVRGDPYVVLGSLAQDIAPDEYRYDIAPYYVERRFEYPRFACYDCHSFAASNNWDPYGAACARFRLVIYDDPSYYPYRYRRGGNVVVARPARPAPRFVFEDARPGARYITYVRGSIDRPQRTIGGGGRTSADVGGPGAVRAPGPGRTGKEPVLPQSRGETWRRRRVSPPAAPPAESTEANLTQDRPD